MTNKFERNQSVRITNILGDAEGAHHHWVGREGCVRRVGYQGDMYWVAIGGQVAVMHEKELEAA